MTTSKLCILGKHGACKKRARVLGFKGPACLCPCHAGNTPAPKSKPGPGIAPPKRRGRPRKVATAATATPMAPRPTSGGKRGRKPKPLPAELTADALVKEREERGLPWAQVAKNLGLESQHLARRAWVELTGRSLDDSGTTKVRAPRGTRNGSRATHAVQWDDDSDQDEIWQAITERRIHVVRSFRGITLDDVFPVKFVYAFTFDGADEDGPLVVHFFEQPAGPDNPGAARSIRVADIREVL